MKLYELLLDGLAALAAVLILAIMVGIGADVAARFLFNRPIGWMLEYTEHGLLLILVFGMPRLVRDGGHVGIDLVLNAVPAKLARVLRMASEFAAALACAVVAVAGIVAAKNDFDFGVETFGIYPVPRFLLMTAVSFGMLLTCIEFSRLLFNTVRNVGEYPGGIFGGLADV